MSNKLPFVVRGEGDNIVLEHLDTNGRSTAARPASSQEKLLFDLVNQYESAQSLLAELHRVALVHAKELGEAETIIERRELLLKIHSQIKQH